MVFLNYWRANETLLSVVNGKLQYVCIYIWIRETPKCGASTLLRKITKVKYQPFIFWSSVAKVTITKKKEL